MVDIHRVYTHFWRQFIPAQERREFLPLLLKWKKFFQKIGSNPEIKDKTVSIRWGELWDFTASAVGGKAFGENQSAILASAKSLHILNSEQVTTGAPGGT